jgi:hypothetical protein
MAENAPNGPPDSQNPSQASTEAVSTQPMPPQASPAPPASPIRLESFSGGHDSGADGNEDGRTEQFVDDIYDDDLSAFGGSGGTSIVPAPPPSHSGSSGAAVDFGSLLVPQVSPH